MVKRPIQGIQLPRINIIVTCTRRKGTTPVKELTLRDVQAPDLRTAFTNWMYRLDGSSAERIPARILYSGDHWNIVRALESEAASSGVDAAVWVSSAGFGLIGIDSKFKPYSATFSSRHPDTTLRWNPTDPRLDDVSWWRLQKEWTVQVGRRRTWSLRPSR